MRGSGHHIGTYGSSATNSLQAFGLGGVGVGRLLIVAPWHHSQLRRLHERWRPRETVRGRQRHGRPRARRLVLVAGGDRMSTPHLIFRPLGRR